MTLPAAHFERWESTERQPIRIEDGRIWGHVTADGTCMRGANECRLIPESGLVGGFHIGSPVELDDGSEIRTGPMTFGGLHLDRRLTLAEARRARHEDSSNVVARVIAWPDPPYGIAVTGSLVPGLPERTVAQMESAGWSVEMWRSPQSGLYELLSVHSVPTPASPIAASADCGCDGSCTSTDERTDLMVVADALSLLTEKVGTLESLLGTKETSGIAIDEPGDNTVSDVTFDTEPEADPEPAPFAALAQYLQSKNADA